MNYAFLATLVGLSTLELAHAQMCTNAYTVTDILPEPGYADSVAFAVSGDGEVVVGASWFGSGGQPFASAFRWTLSGGLAPLAGFDPTRSSEAFGVSGDGAVVAGMAERSTGLPVPVVWSGGAIIDILQLAGITAPGVARAVSHDGSVTVGEYFVGTDFRAFRWTAGGGLQDLGSLGTSAKALAVSGDGRVVVGVTDVPGGLGDQHAFRWTAATGMQDLGTLGGSFSEALAISRDGSVIAGWSSPAGGTARAFRWTAAAGMVGVGPAFGANSKFSAANADGSLLVGRGFASGNEMALWNAGIDPIDLSEYEPTATSALGVSSGGSVIVGTRALNAFGATRAVVIHGRELGTSYCNEVVPSSTGCPARLFAAGSPHVAAGDVTLHAVGLPMNVTGLFVAGRSGALVASPGGSQGVLCLGGVLGRFAGPGQIQNSGFTGAFRLGLDLAALPTASGFAAAAAGETWTFQAWFRDQNPGSTSNFSDALAVTFR